MPTKRKKNTANKLPSKKSFKNKKKRSSKKDSDLFIIFSAVKYLFLGVYYFFKYLGIGVFWLGKGIFIFCKYLIKKINKFIYYFKKKESISDDNSNKNKGSLKTNDKSQIENYDSFSVVEKIDGSYSKFEDFILTNKSTIGLIIGARGTGKSTVGMRILENIHAITKRKCFAMGFKAGELPRFIKSIGGISELENDGIILIDEGGILFNARNSMDNANKLLSELLLIARHKDLSVIFITQNSSNLEVNVIRQADYLILKPSSLLQKDFERKKIQKLYNEVSDKFKKYEDMTGITYIYSNKFVGFITNTIPSFWNENLSKSFSGK